MSFIRIVKPIECILTLQFNPMAMFKPCCKIKGVINIRPFFVNMNILFHASVPSRML